MSNFSHIFLKPLSEIKYSLAKVVIGFDQTKSYNSCLVTSTFSMIYSSLQKTIKGIKSGVKIEINPSTVLSAGSIFSGVMGRCSI